MKIVFMGTTGFGIPALDALASAGHEILCVVSTPARQKGRGLKIVESDIAQHCRKMGFQPVLCPPDLTSVELVSELRSFGADAFVVVAFRILPKEIFSIPVNGTYNIHASLLPKYRGPAPIQRAIAAGETKTGITVFRIDRGVDTGGIVLQKETPIADDDTTPTLSDKLSLLGGQGICEALSLVQDGAVELKKQDTTRATAAPKLVRSEGKINWDTPARSIYNAIRAFTPFPGSFSFFNDAKFTIERAKPLESPGTHSEAGTILAVSQDGFDVQCHDGALRVLAVKPEGKKSMSARDFANGRNISKGTKLE